VAACASTLSSCGGTLQDRPIPHNLLEYMVTAPFPVYWLGASFGGLAISEVAHDPSDAWSIEYGNCLEGGEGTCVPPLRIVTSPDNSFHPGGLAPTRTMPIRGVRAILAQEGKTIIIPTDGVVVDIYANSAPTAIAAAHTAVPINELGATGAPLPSVLAPNGVGETPLPSQVPAPLRPAP
jgi:hypothetical protein